MFFQFASEVNAAKTLMTGDFAKDTIAVSSTLKETITLPKEDKGLSETEKEAVFLISEKSALIPEANPKEVKIIDFPAPVSPEKTVKP